MFSHLDAAARQVPWAAAEQTDEGDIPQNKHGNYYYIVPVVGRVVDKQFDPVSRCEEDSGRRGEVPDVETVVLPKSAEETRLWSRVWWCRLVFGRFKGLLDPQLHR